jgi:hypothetical protein
MDPVKRERLEKTWAHQYRARALPLIEEKPFAKYFDPANGRPNKSVQLLVSVLLLKEIKNLTDEEVLEHLEWNTSWHYALDITPEEAHTCQKTLHNFRRRLLDDDKGAALFEGTTARVIAAAGLSTGRQRLDSTHIVSNIRLLTRLGLFVDTLTHFLSDVRKEHPRLYAALPEELDERYLEREGYFADARSSEAPRRLQETAQDIHFVVRWFEAQGTVCKMESYILLSRLYEEQFVVPTTDLPKRIELQEKPSSSSLQSPSDPDATYGHKGKGYEVQLTETCDENNPFQVVTAVGVNGANESDQHQVEPALEQTERTCGRAPKKLHTDCGYGSGENIVKAQQEHGTELLAPIGAKESEKHVPLGQFEFNAEGTLVVKCPMGQVPVEQKPTRGGKAMLALFTKEQCRDCPFRGRCPAEKRGAVRVLRFGAADVAVARRRVEQETPEFKEAHKIRSGIEATNSELKRCHGLRKLRVRRRPQVELSVRLKVLALNIKRYVGHLTTRLTPELAVAPACGC